MENGIFIPDYQTQNGTRKKQRLVTQQKMKNKALELLEQIEENVSVCCAITMEPEEVLDMIDQLREEISKL
jgi:hypothetical protein